MAHTVCIKIPIVTGFERLGITTDDVERHLNLYLKETLGGRQPRQVEILSGALYDVLAMAVKRATYEAQKKQHTGSIDFEVGKKRCSLAAWVVIADKILKKKSFLFRGFWSALIS